MPKQPEEALRSSAVLAEQTRKPRSPVGRDTPYSKRIYSGWEDALRPKLTRDQRGKLGLGWSADSFALRRLVSDGQDERLRWGRCLPVAYLHRDVVVGPSGQVGGGRRPADQPARVDDHAAGRF